MIMEFPSTTLQLDIPLNLKTQEYWKEKGINSDVWFGRDAYLQQQGQCGQHQVRFDN